MATHPMLGLMHTVEGLRKLGEDPDPVLLHEGIDPQNMDPASKIDRGLELKIYVALAERLANPLAGLKIGAHSALTSFGALTLMIMSCENYAQAFELGLRYQDLTYAFSRMTLEQGKEHYVLDLDLLPMPAKAFRFLMDLELAGTLKLGEDLRGPTGVSILPPLRMEMPYPRPKEAAAYEAHFGCPIRFGRPSARVWIRKEAFFQPFVTRKPSALQLYRKQCEKLALRHRRHSLGTLAEKVSLHLKLCGTNVPDTGTIAGHFNMSLRTFRRRLDQEGTSYRKLVNENRCRHAQALLQNSQLSTEEIAEKLGYAEPSAFTRAFKSWSGTTPQAFRKRTASG